MYKTMTGLAGRIQFLIECEYKAMSADDPKGTCAAHHRGQIHAYESVLALITPESVFKKYQERAERRKKIYLLDTYKATKQTKRRLLRRGT